MQYVRSIGGSVSKTWNSINPATLSGAIDVIVVEQDDGLLACSPFHVRFGKFSLLRPYEKKVEFKVNNVKQHHAMKLGEGGEAFFVFETWDDIPESLQTSPVISPAASPQSLSQQDVVAPPTLQEPEFLDLNTNATNVGRGERGPQSRPVIPSNARTQSDFGPLTPLSASPGTDPGTLADHTWSAPHERSTQQIKKSTSEELLPTVTHAQPVRFRGPIPTMTQDTQPESPLMPERATSAPTEHSQSPPPLSPNDALNRARSKLSMSNIPTRVTDSGDLMLDMTGYKSSEENALRAEVIARNILSEEHDGCDIGALVDVDDHGNLWIYNSEEAKEAAGRKIALRGLDPGAVLSDAASDPGYQSDEERLCTESETQKKHSHARSDMTVAGLTTPPQTPPAEGPSSGDPNRNYAKTLRLTSDQLKALNLKPGENTMSFSVNRATCQAYMYYWKYDVPIVISDIDGTITKSDALGHVLNMIGRDWTHIGVAKLYSDIVANGYNILYLTSRSVGQADTTRTYLNGISQEGFRLPKGPVIMSPDRTFSALKREVYLRKPEVFKMACLRDILNLFSHRPNPFYAGFGNRFTDALSYRSVNIPSSRIFTINSNAELSLDLLTLNKYKSSYVSMREVVDHFFPPVGLLVESGGEDFTDFNYWREAPLEIEDFPDSDSEDNHRRGKDNQSLRSEDEGSDGLDDDDEAEDGMADSYMSRDSIDEGRLIDSVIESIDDGDLIRRTSREGDDDPDTTPDAVVDIPLTAIKAESEGSVDGMASKAHLDRVKATEAVRSAIRDARAG